MTESALGRAAEALQRADLHERRGRVTNLIGLVIEATGLDAEIGEVCEIGTGRNGGTIPAEVVGFRDGRTLLMPLGQLEGIGPGKSVRATGHSFRLPVGDALLGRVLDGLGRPLDGRPAPLGEAV
jgi:flagellum-specific ATP synthase